MNSDLKLFSTVTIAVILMFLLLGLEVEAADRYALLRGGIEHGQHAQLDAIFESVPQGGSLLLEIDSPGGSLAQLMAWMKFFESREDIQLQCYVGPNSMAASAAALLLLTCDQIKVADTAEVMFHLPYYEIMDVHGILHIVRDAQISFQIYSYFNQYGLKDVLNYYNLVEPFLAGYDIVLTGEEFKKALTSAQ